MFCIVKGLEKLGVGKVIDADGTWWTVEYFDTPAHASHDVRSVRNSTIIRKKLGANTRLYYNDGETGQWLVGRVLQDTGDGIEARLSGGRDVLFEYHEIFVRCKKPIADPVDYLALAITEVPQYAEGRSQFLASYIKQRGTAMGISALLSSVIELESHQIDVVRRVLSDSSQRYLLADEVGLGKTIEAGVIIRQAVLDDPPNHRVVVLVPRALVAQWRQELIRRFGLLDFIDDSVCVVAHDVGTRELAELLQVATMLVIDEAHHIATNDNRQFDQLYECVRNCAQTIERILLLSATPVLRNETGFLRMLHLLDPKVYPLDGEKEFRLKIEHRQLLAESVAMLDPDNALDLAGVLEELLEKLPSDDRLHQLAASLKMRLVGVPDPADPKLNEAIRLLRAHLSETYRLHRRILRNRRKRVTGLTPNRTGAEVMPVQESNMAPFESILEEWRISATATDHVALSSVHHKLRTEFYLCIVRAILGNPSEVVAICEERIEQLKATPDLGFSGEAENLRELARGLDFSDWFQRRFECLVNGLGAVLVGKTKVIVFCSNGQIADELFEALRHIFRLAVVRHTISLDDEGDDELEWTNFNTTESIRVLVCDQRAEEGINLQGGSKAVIHFDLPLEPNRIEQRMGRVDRYGAGDAVKSYVLVDEGSKYQAAWYLALSNALGVFNHSISSLQYLIEDEISYLQGIVFVDGIEAIQAFNEKLGGENGAVAQELKRIDQQDSLDELSPMPEAVLEAVLECDDDWESIRKATIGWAGDTLLFSQLSENSIGIDRPLDPPFRFQYRVPGRGGKATLLPLSGFLDEFLGAVDYEDPRSNSSKPLSYAHCARRQSGVKRGVRLLRYGDEFIEALKSFTDRDDRGRSYAIWRQVREGLPRQENQMYFRFDFLIEADLTEAQSFLASVGSATDTANAAIARRGDALFSPRVEQIWIDEEGEEASVEFVASFLSRSYRGQGVNHNCQDANLKSLRLRELMESLPDTFRNWDLRCVRMRDVAADILTKKVDLTKAVTDAMVRARGEDEIWEAQLATRIRMLDGVEACSEEAQLLLGRDLNAALYKGIVKPSIRVDVVGVVILSHSSCPAEENA